MKYWFIVLLFIYTQGLSQTDLQERVDTLHAMVINTWLNYPDSAVELAREAYRLSLESEDKAAISKSLRLIGGVHNYLANYDSTIWYCNASYDIAREIGDMELVNNALNNIGLANYNLGSYQNALEYLLRSLSIKKQHDFQYGLGTTLNNVGLVYTKLKDYTKAREYFKEALDVSNQQNDASLILYSQNNIGDTYLRQNRLDMAQFYFQKSIDLEVDNKTWKATAYAGMAQVMQARGLYMEASKYYNIASDLRKEIGDKPGMSQLMYLRSKENKEMREFDSAILLLNRSQELAESIGAKDRMLENLSLYVEIYEDLGNPQKAFEYQTELINLKENLFNENLARNLSAIELRLQEEENQRVIEKKDSQLLQNRKYIISLVIVVALIFLLVVIYYRQVKVIKKQNAELYESNFQISQQKEEIETQKESLMEKNNQLVDAQRVIQEQNEKLETYNAQLLDAVVETSDKLKERNDQLMLANIELDNFIYKSSHDIKGPLATLLGMCNIAMIDIQEEQANGYFKKIYEAALDLNAILTRLKTISEIANKPLKYELINFSQIIQHGVEQNRKIEGNNRIDVQMEIPEGLKYRSDATLLDLIFFNLIQSVIKMRTEINHSHPINVEVAMLKQVLTIDVIDQGDGRIKMELDDVFEHFASTALHHRTLGLGLYIVKQSIHRLGGNITLLDDLNHTHFNIRLPVLS